VETSITKIKTALNALDGDLNLENAKKAIDELSNLSETTRNNIKTNLPEITKLGDKNVLDNEVTKFTDINNYIETKKSEIKSFNHLSPELQTGIIASLGEIRDLTKSQSEIKTAIDTKTNQAQILNNKYDELKAAVAAYKNVFTKPQYTEATSANKTTQNQKVKQALESVLKDKIYGDLETDLQELTNETFKQETTLSNVETAIENVKNALNALNGLTKVEEAKAKLRAKVNDSTGIYNGLNQVTKTAILNDVNKLETNTIEKVNAIDVNANQTLNINTQLQTKIDELKAYKNDKDYKLADVSKQIAFDDALTKLEEQANQNLFDNAIRNQVENAITTATNAKTDLNGNENLTATKTAIGILTNLSETTKINITT
ncbi:hypothetical protein ACW95P_04955, partial [Candidatus Mycoplasma pogonae]